MSGAAGSISSIANGRVARTSSTDAVGAPALRRMALIGLCTRGAMCQAIMRDMQNMTEQERAQFDADTRAAALGASMLTLLRTAQTAVQEFQQYLMETLYAEEHTREKLFRMATSAAIGAMKRSGDTGGGGGAVVAAATSTASGGGGGGGGPMAAGTAPITIAAAITTASSAVTTTTTALTGDAPPDNCVPATRSTSDGDTDSTSAPPSPPQQQQQQQHHHNNKQLQLQPVARPSESPLDRARVVGWGRARPSDGASRKRRWAGDSVDSVNPLTTAIEAARANELALAAASRPAGLRVPPPVRPLVVPQPVTDSPDGVLSEEHLQAARIAAAGLQSRPWLL